jgi:ABC-type uncharacterized transport system ATPase subunit
MPSMPLKLSVVRIEGYRSCVATQFAVNGELSILIGANGAGKTNVLQAIRLLRAWSAESRYGFRRDVDIATLQCRLCAEFVIGQSTISLRSAIDYVLDDENNERVVKISDEWRDGPLDISRNSGSNWTEIHPAILDIIRSNKPRSRSHINLSESFRGELPDKLGLQYEAIRKLPPDFIANVEKIIGFREHIRYYSASQFTNPAGCPTSIEIDSEKQLTRFGASTNRRDHSKFIYDLYREYAAASEKYAAYLSIVGKEGLALITEIKWTKVQVPSREVLVRAGGKIVKRKRQRSLVVPSVKSIGERLSFGQLSEGTFKALVLIFYLVTDDSALLLIEEPEVCVHHGLLASLVELIKTQSKTKQIVVTTHSDFLLDKVLPEHVYGVSNSARKGTLVRNLAAGSAKQIEQLRAYLTKEGNLGELWRQGGLPL